MPSLAVALVLGLALLAPASAAADTVTIAPPPEAPVVGTEVQVPVTVTGSPGMIVVAFVRPGASSCPPTAELAGDNAEVMDPGEVALPATGVIAVTEAYMPGQPGSATVCAYVTSAYDAVTTAVGQILLTINAFTLGKKPPVGEAPGQIFSRLHHHMFGTQPLPISIGVAHRPANGDSGGAAVSGDNRKTRLAAFHSAASNLVRGDTNGNTDVFVWQRPRGRAGLTLDRLGGVLQRVSVNSGGGEANGDSTNPSLDGSITSVPHCVAFQSTATNLAGGDRDSAPDVYVRDLRSRHTYLVSGGVGSAATHPSIDGHCRRVAFEAGGGVWMGSAHGGRAHRLSSGSQPVFSRDGS